MESSRVVALSMSSPLLPNKPIGKQASVVKAGWNPSRLDDQRNSRVDNSLGLFTSICLFDMFKMSLMLSH